MSVNPAKSGLVVVALLAVAVVALILTPSARLAEGGGVPTTLPDQIGEWSSRIIRYCHAPDCRNDVFYLDDLPGDKTKCPKCGAPLFPMSWPEYDQLPKETKFVKALYTNPRGRQIFVSIVMSGIDREAIHRPERCLIGQGNSITATRTESIALTKNRLLKLKVLLASWTGGAISGSHSKHIYFAYWFIGHGRETPSHYWRMFWIAMDRLLHNVAYEWAYVSVQSTRPTEDSLEYVKELNEFTPLLHEALMSQPGVTPQPGVRPAAASATAAPAP